MILTSASFADPPCDRHRQTDRQTDGRTDGRTISYSALCIYDVAYL